MVIDDLEEVTGVVSVDEIPRLVEQLTVKAFRGPMPPPDLLREYEEILPGFADRTLRQTEKIIDHRIEMQRAQIDATVRLASRGQLFGFLIALIAILGGIGLILDNKSTEGLVAIFVPLAAMLGVFVHNHIQSGRTDAGHVEEHPEGDAPDQETPR